MFLQGVDTGQFFHKEHIQSWGAVPSIDCCAGHAPQPPRDRGFKD